MSDPTNDEPLRNKSLPPERTEIVPVEPVTKPKQATQQVFGNYRLLRQLGEGGMGEVYLAVHIKLGRKVALKRIRPERLRTPTAVKRFLREVRAAARVDHPYIVRAYDAGSEGTCHYLVMELIDGIDLKTYVTKNGPRPVEEVLRVALEVGLALQHLNDHGLVHRDLKPTNLIRVKQTGCVKVLDLGLARVDPVGPSDDQSQSMTLRGTVLGTPDYMAPEQVMNAKAADIKADLYSLGCTLYFLLTGRVPFPGGTPMEKMLRQAQETPKPISAWRTGIPSEVLNVVEKLMAKDPKNRFESPRELIQSLKSLADQPTTLASDNAATLAKDVDQSPSESEFWQNQFGEFVRKESTLVEAGLDAPQVKRKRPRWVQIFVGLSVLHVCIAFGLYYTFGRQKSSTTGSATAETIPSFNDDSSKRRELFIQYQTKFGTSEGVKLASEIRKLTSPLETLPIPSNVSSSLRIGDPKFHHYSWVRSIDASPDGRWLASGGWERGVRLWDLKKKNQKFTLKGHETPIWNVAFSPNGKLVVGVSGFDGPQQFEQGFERSLRVWDTNSGMERFKIDFERGGWCLTAGFSPDGKKLLVGQYDQASLWDVESWERIVDVKNDQMNWTSAVAFSPDGKFFFTGGTLRQQVRVWETETGKFIRSFSANQSPILCLKSASDGRRLIEISEGGLRIWDWTTGTQIKEFRFPNRAVSCGSWGSNEQEIIIGSSDGFIGWFDADSGEQRKSIDIQGVEFTCMSTVPNSELLVVGSKEGGLRQFHWKSGQEVEPLPLQAPIKELWFAEQDRRLVYSSEIGSPKRVSLPDGKMNTGKNLELTRTFQPMPDGTGVLALDHDFKPVIWNALDNQLFPIHWPEATNARLAIATPDRHGLIQVLQYQKTLRYRELRDGDQDEKINEESEIRCIAMNQLGSMAAYGTERGEVVIVRLPTLELINRVSLGGSNVRKIVFSPEGEFVYAIGGNTGVSQINLNSGQWVGLRGSEGQHLSLTVSADARYVAVGTMTGDIVLLPAVNGVSPRRLKSTGPAQALSFSVDSSTLAAGFGNGVVELYRLSGMK